MDISTLGQELLDLLKTENHPLENYIYAYDHSVDSETLLWVIGERIGIDVYNDIDPAVSLFLKLKEYIENEKDVEETRRKVNMSLQQFSEQYPNLSEEEMYNLYANRLFLHF